MASWSLRNFELFAHRGYYGDNKMPGFQACADKGIFIETDVVKTGSGTFFMQHDRTLTYNGESVHITTLTDEQYRSVVGEDAVTLDAFLAWLKNYPDMRVMCDFYIGADDVVRRISESGTLGQWIMNTSTTNLTYPDEYPELSYCYTQAVDSEEQLDALRTASNIVTSFSGGTPNHKILTCGGYEAFTADNIEDWIAKGLTWFQSSHNGNNLDALKTKLATYKAPGYSQNLMCSHIADAVRSKTGSADAIAARNFPSEIRKLTTFAPGEAINTLDITIVSNNNVPSFRGFFPVEQINIDMGGFTGAVVPAYFAMSGTNGGKIVFKNCANASLGGDFLRNAYNIAEVVFEGGIYPSGTVTRLCQGTGTNNELSALVSQNIDTLTIRGIHLDNVTAFNAFGSSCTMRWLDIEWEGTLNASVNVSTCNKLTEASVNRLVSCLADYSAGDAHTLTLGSTQLARVTEENLALAAARNWTLV